MDAPTTIPLPCPLSAGWEWTRQGNGGGCIHGECSDQRAARSLRGKDVASEQTAPGNGAEGGLELERHPADHVHRLIIPIMFTARLGAKMSPL